MGLIPKPMSQFIVVEASDFSKTVCALCAFLQGVTAYKLSQCHNYHHCPILYAESKHESPEMASWKSQLLTAGLAWGLGWIQEHQTALCATSFLLAPEDGLLKCRSCHIVPRVAQKSLGSNCI